jgi:hypothetical protein
MGAVNQSPNSRLGAPDVTPGFAVTQALVSLLATHGGTSLTSTVKGTPLRKLPSHLYKHKKCISIKVDIKIKKLAI